MFSVRLKGLNKLTSATTSVAAGIGRDIAAGIREAAAVVEGESKKAITSGYTRAILTGNLRRSIGIGEIRPFRATVRPTAYYATYVHEGTSRMRPRPFMKVGLENSHDAIEKIFKGKIQASLNRIK